MSVHEVKGFRPLVESFKNANQVCGGVLIKHDQETQNIRNIIENGYLLILKEEIQYNSGWIGCVVKSP